MWDYENAVYFHFTISYLQSIKKLERERETSAREIWANTTNYTWRNNDEVRLCCEWKIFMDSLWLYYMNLSLSCSVVNSQSSTSYHRHVDDRAQIGPQHSTTNSWESCDGGKMKIHFIHHPCTSINYPTPLRSISSPMIIYVPSSRSARWDEIWRGARWSEAKNVISHWMALECKRSSPHESLAIMIIAVFFLFR